MSDRSQEEPKRSPVHVLLTLAVGLFLLVGAVGKALAPDGVVNVIAFVLEPIGVGAAAGLWLAGVVIFLEGLLAWALLCHVRLRAALLATFLTLVGFTFVLAYLTLRPHAPPCGCGGAFSLATQVSENPTVGIFRNLGLIWLVCWLWLKAPIGTSPDGVGETRPAAVV